MWNDAESSMISPGEWTQVQQIPPNGELSNDLTSPGVLVQPPSRSSTDPRGRHKDSVPIPTPLNTESTLVPDDSQLTEHFKHADAPPILAPIETSFRWGAMRKLFASMALESKMVKYAVMAFSALQLEESGSNPKVNYVPYYDLCKKELSNYMLETRGNSRLIANDIQHVLAVLFLLSYIDVRPVISSRLQTSLPILSPSRQSLLTQEQLVTDRATFAHSNLREAYTIFRSLDLRSLNINGRFFPFNSHIPGFDQLIGTI